MTCDVFAIDTTDHLPAIPRRASKWPPTPDVGFIFTTSYPTYWPCPDCGRPRDATLNHDEVYHPVVAQMAWDLFRKDRPDAKRIALYEGQVFYPEGNPDHRIVVDGDPTYATGTHEPRFVGPAPAIYEAATTLNGRPLMQIERGWLKRAWKAITRRRHG